MKIVTSVYADASSRPLRSLVSLLEECRVTSLYFDGKERPSVFDDIQHIRETSTTPIHLHLSRPDPLPPIDQIKSLGIQRLSFEYEALPSDVTLPPPPRGTQYGLSLSLSTPIDVFDKYKKACDFVLLMPSDEEQIEAPLTPDLFRKVHAFRRAFPGKQVDICGKVNNEIQLITKLLGVHAVISSSPLRSATSIEKAFASLRQPLTQSEYLVEDFMLPLSLTPQLSIENAPDLQRVMQSIETQGLGFVCYTNPSTHQFLGICSNADIRRGILKYFHQLPQLSWQQLWNKNPFTLSPRSSVLDMLRLLQQQSFVVSFVPVVNAARQLRGALTFFHLIQNET